MCSRISTWITSAPQSASWRAAVGPARTCVMSTTRKRERAWEAGRCGISLNLPENVAMDSLIAAAARALVVGDALGALKRVGLRDDPPALALRGIAMAQLGEHPRARELLRRAARHRPPGAPPPRHRHGPARRAPPRPRALPARRPRLRRPRGAFARPLCRRRGRGGPRHARPPRLPGPA